MTCEMEDTIAALSTAPGAAAIGAVRITGPGTTAVLGRLLGGRPETRPRTVRTAWLLDPSTGERVDRVLYFFFKGPASYTGEDLAEVHGHGGVRNMERLLACVLASGARPARPGEFTLRAFLHGKMDLIRAEAVLSVVSARSEKALKAAQGQLGGVLSAEVEDIRGLMVSQLARLEASIDFPDDAGELDVEENALAEIELRLGRLAGKWNTSRRLAEGLRVVITGRPNAGKSSLLNALLGRERAIVDPRPGTTRDYIEAAAEIEGHAMTLVDTAGLRETGDRIELLGMRAAREVMGGADAIVLVVDERGITIDEIDRVLRGSGGALLVPVLNKQDLGWTLPEEARRELEPHAPVPASCVTGRGVDRVEARLVSIAGGDLDMSEPMLLSARHFDRVRESMDEVRAMRRAQREGHPGDIVATHLRGAVSAVDEMTGREVVADTLDEIFARFCIGK
jgi:tRNA modification GTPase